MTPFPKGARVCFVGDSITHNNIHVAHIAAFYKKHFPEQKISFFNCGISGGEVPTSLAVFDEDIAPYRPTHAVVMLGTNDCGLYNLEEPGSARYDAIKDGFEKFKTCYDELCKKLKGFASGS